MKKLLFIISLIALYSNSLCANFDPRLFDYSKVDSIVEATFVKTEYTTTLELANAINVRFDTQHEQYRAIYKWITLNIDYDLNNSGVEANKILTNKKAVCEGYSSLLLDLCKKTEIQCVSVTGYCHNDPYYFGPLSSEPNHAWNIITLNNQQYLTDITWATSGYNPEKGVYEKTFDKTYFLVNPEQFSINHYPDNANYQLLKKVVKKETFENFPNSGSGLRKFDLYNISPLIKLIKCRLGGKNVFNFSTKKAVIDVDFYIESEDIYELIPILFEKDENDYSFYWEFESKGTFIVRIDINKIDALYYKVTVE